jgi:hypothetical protein
MTREQVLAHVAFMAQWDAAYAANALKWYRANLPWMGLIASAVEAPPPPHLGSSTASPARAVRTAKSP